MLFPRENNVREVKDLSGIWRFCTDPKGRGKQEGWFSRPLQNTRPMPVPASYNDITQDISLRDYLGDVWYETTFFVPRSFQDKRTVLRFGSVTHHATVWLNGIELISHKGGYLPFECEISDIVSFDSPNRLTVLVNNLLDFTTIPPGELKTYGDDHPDGFRTLTYHHDFFNYAGIHRPVRLYCTPKTYIKDIDVATRLSGDVSYRITTNRETEVTAVLYDKDGISVASQSGADGTLSVPNPHLWEPGKPYLYRLSISAGEDLYVLPIGIRTAEVKGNQFLINGKPFYFQGFGKHEDMDVKGKGLDLAMNVKDANLLQWMGANSFRTSHYPYAEEWLDLADELGIVVIDETTAVGFQFWNGETVFRPDRVGKEALAHHIDVMEELYARDKNHPSVVMWSVGNESRTEEDGARAHYEAVISRLRKLEQNRPITIVMNVVPEEDQVGDLVDMICVNTYESWYSDPGHTEVIEHRVTQILNRWYRRYQKPLMMSEFGADTIAGMHQNPPVMFSEEYQCEVLKHYHAAMDRLDFVVGEHVWAFADFQTKQGITRVMGNKKGVFTRERQPKMAAHLLRERWTRMKGEKPICK